MFFQKNYKLFVYFFGITINQHTWVVTYGLFDEYSSLDWTTCTNIEFALEKYLFGIYQNVEYLEHRIDSEEFTVRFGINASYEIKHDVPELMEIDYDGKAYKLSLLDLQIFEEVYKKSFDDLPTLVKCISEDGKKYLFLGLKLIKDAIRCYESEIYDASVLLCRTAIDSSIYLYAVLDKESDPFEGSEKIYWDKLKEFLIKECKYSENELLNLYNNVRELGNFAAHMGEKMTREYSAWKIENEELLESIKKRSIRGEKINPKEFPIESKRSTSVAEASMAIEQTIMFLLDFASRVN